jgi:hypothetical protein
MLRNAAATPAPIADPKSTSVEASRDFSDFFGFGAEGSTSAGTSSSTSSLSTSSDIQDPLYKWVHSHLLDQFGYHPKTLIDGG